MILVKNLQSLKKSFIKDLNTYFLMLSFLGLVGCGSLVTRSDLKEAEQKKSVQEQVTQIQKSHADTASKFADIDSDLRDLSGRVEVVENKLHTTNADKDKSNKQSLDLIQEQNRKIQLLQEELTRQDNQINMMMADINNLKSALSQAVAAQREEVEKAKKDPFDLAEENFKAGEWKKAILNYQKYRDANPKSKKFADATYKIGVSFQELGMKEEAKSFFDEVIAKYPSAPEAKKAKSRLKNLKK